MKSRSSSSMRWVVWARVACQTFFFALFFVGLLRTHGPASQGVSGLNGFFHFDPLLGLVAMAASRTVVAAYGLALITVVATALFGRYVCGWVCPLGSLLHFVSFVFAKLKWTKSKVEKGGALRWKYAILAAIVAGSVFSLDLAGFLDPLSLLYRSFSTAVLPAAAYVARSAAELLQRLGLPAAGAGWSAVQQNWMLHESYRQGAAIGAILVWVLLLNLLRPRFWCRYLCPAGALLGLVARWHPFQVKMEAEGCNGCQLCTRHCPAQAGPHPSGTWKRSECFHCYGCAAQCPQDAMGFPALTMPEARPEAVDPTRRELVLAAGLGAVAVPLLHVPGGERPSEKLIRPPGALAEAEFLSKCIKCGECMKVCPANGLHHAYLEGSALALWTPVLVPRIGYCEPSCTLCSQVCPTGAIQPLSAEQKPQTKLGTAWIRKNRCQPYSYAEPCHICEQKCPTSPKAILMAPIEFAGPDGPISMQAPVVDPTLCIGCGICEHSCPSMDEPGIYCTNYGETRSEKRLQ